MRNAIWAAMLLLPLVVAASERSLDESFYKRATEGGLAEVQLGQLAQDKGDSQAVRDFGKMMVQDHTAVNDKLKTLASGTGVELPTSPGPDQMVAQSSLETLSGRSFDKSYIGTMVQDHKDTIALFRKEAKSGQDKAAKEFALTTLPTLYDHLRNIEQIAKTADR